MAAFRLQSAMEYLMTYGWAILIIAVVLGALFELGFFNSSAFAPKIGPGSCQVYRPQGPGTTAFESLEGTCNNELPQYVASFNSNSLISAESSYGTGLGSSQYRNFTIVAWIYPRSIINGASLYTEGVPETNMELQLGQPISLNICLPFGGSGDWTGYFPTAQNALTNGWTFIASSTWTSGGAANYNLYYYQNGVLQHYSSSGTDFYVGCSYPSGTVDYLGIGGNIGSAYGGGQSINGFNGLIADVQVYNSTFSANEINALYQEGIGGVPIDLNNLVGWWPLNGNANDYSGNKANGLPANVTFTTSWTSRYTAP